MDLDPNAGHDLTRSTALRSVWHLASALYRDLGTLYALCGIQYLLAYRVAVLKATNLNARICN